MNILIFLFILAILVLVHELGHFIVAKKNGIKVDEFGLGFPPRLWGKKFGETVYSLNLLPLGGFVKIFGENGESLETPEGGKEEPSRSLAFKNRAVQAAVLGAGVSFNAIFAWLIISLGLVWGLPTAIDETNAAYAKDSRLVVSSVLPQSPAEISGLKPGDILVSLKNEGLTLSQNLNPETVHNFIVASRGQIEISYKRGTKIAESKIEAKEGIALGGRAVGIGMDTVGTVKLPIGKAFIEGTIVTGRMFTNITLGIFHFIGDAVLGHADLSSVAGPVGMITMVGDAHDLGFAYLVFFTAILSINLAVINLLPFPALDGGRLVMVLVEVIKGSPIKPKIVNGINTAGLALLMLLMLAVTYHDILKLF